MKEREIILYRFAEIFRRNVEKNIFLYVHKRKEIKNYFEVFFCTY